MTTHTPFPKSPRHQPTHKTQPNSSTPQHLQRPHQLTHSLRLSHIPNRLYLSEPLFKVPRRTRHADNSRTGCVEGYEVGVRRWYAGFLTLDVELEYVTLEFDYGFSVGDY